tara:strand:- start:20759 stop:22492 length:1734 start_codon:yes stop_codon:yes gene_type:complete
MYISNKIDKFEKINLQITQSVTIMFWIQMDENRLQREFLCGNNPFYDIGIVLEKSISNQISFYCGNGTKIENEHAKYSAYTGRLPYNKYSHVCFTRNNDHIYVYVNGKLHRTYSVGKVNLINNTITIGKSKYYYLDDLSQSVKFFKLYNNELNITNINQLIHKDIYAYYFNDKCSKLLNIFNVSVLNYRFNFNNITYIYNDNLFVNYTKSNYNEIVKLNSLSLNDIKPLIDNNTNINEKVLEDENIHNIVENIISWQFGMYQDEYPKVIETSTIGFWSKRECNFFEKYTGKGMSWTHSNGEIKYNYGSLQDGTGVFIKLIIDYYLKYKEQNSSLISDCFTSINLFIDYLNEMIYDNGGIPEYFPLQGNTFDNICLNDGAFIDYLRCCDFILNTEIKNEINEGKINLLKQNYNKALDCILYLQITVNGKKTIWAQQYDPVTLLPTSARSFEKESLCSLESAQLLIYLMSLPKPDVKIKTAIYNGCDWFKQNGITNYKQVINDGHHSIITNLNNERNLYARYYSLENNGPIFFDREGITYNLESFNQIPDEMRNGYTWLGCWGDYLLEIYSFWKTIHQP